MPVRKDGITLVDQSAGGVGLLALENGNLAFLVGQLEFLVGAAAINGAGGPNPFGLQIAGFDGTNPRFIRVDTQGNLQVEVLAETKLTLVSGEVSSSGNNILVTPTASKKLRLAYVSYNPSAAVDLSFRFGVAGPLFMRNNVTVGGSIISKDFGDMKYAEGAANESLYLNLSSAVSTIWNAFYTEQ